MLQNFRSYHVAVEFYQECESIYLKAYLKDQLMRAALSIVNNLAEGSAKPTEADRRRFYSISLASFREVQSILLITKNAVLVQKFDHLGGMLYRLSRKPQF